VDNQTAFLDCDNIEKERGITVFAEQAEMEAI
jgi:predicted membrane GTPase involved in stress response